MACSGRWASSSAPCTISTHRHRSFGHVPDRAIGNHGDLHVPRKIHDPLYRRRGEPGAQRAGLLTRDEDLGDAMNPREVDYRLGDVASFKNPGLDLQTA